MFVRSRGVWFRFAENLKLKIVSINVLFCNSAGIPIKTSRCDDMHEFIILLLM